MDSIGLFLKLFDSAVIAARNLTCNIWDVGHRLLKNQLSRSDINVTIERTPMMVLAVGLLAIIIALGSGDLTGSANETKIQSTGKDHFRGMRSERDADLSATMGYL